MKKKVLIASVSVLGLMLSGCAGVGNLNNALVEKQKNVEYYRIFDIKTKADRDTVADAASTGLGKNVNNAREARPIPESATLPDQPGRFKLSNPFEGSQMGQLGALMNAGGGLGAKVATCSGSSWNAQAVRDIAGSSNLRVTACLFPYKEGYHLDVYGTFAKQEGGLMQAVRSGVGAMVGTPEEWTEKTFMDIAREIRKQTNAEVTLVEGYPKVQGTPWLDSGETIQAAK